MSIMRPTPATQMQPVARTPGFFHGCACCGPAIREHQGYRGSHPAIPWCIHRLHDPARHRPVRYGRSPAAIRQKAGRQTGRRRFSGLVCQAWLLNVSAKNCSPDGMKRNPGLRRSAHPGLRCASSGLRVFTGLFCFPGPILLIIPAVAANQKQHRPSPLHQEFL